MCRWSTHLSGRDNAQLYVLHVTVPHYESQTLLSFGYFKYNEAAYSRRNLFNIKLQLCILCMVHHHVTVTQKPVRIANAIAYTARPEYYDHSGIVQMYYCDGSAS